MNSPLINFEENQSIIGGKRILIDRFTLIFLAQIFKKVSKMIDEFSTMEALASVWKNHSMKLTPEVICDIFPKLN